MDIVVGCPVAERAWALPDWLDAVRSQRVPDGAELKLMFVYTKSRDRTLDILEATGGRIIEESLHSRAFDRIERHHWAQSNGDYKYMSVLRNTLREEVQRAGAMWFFSLDSDVMLPHENVLCDLIEVADACSAAAVSPLVDMQEVLPGVRRHLPAWNFMYSSANGLTGERRSASPPSNPFEVGVIMAAMLIHRRAMSIRWADHHQGEDIGWSIRARRSGHKLFVEPRIVCEHRMRRGDDKTRD